MIRDSFLNELMEETFGALDMKIHRHEILTVIPTEDSRAGYVMEQAQADPPDPLKDPPDPLKIESNQGQGFQHHAPVPHADEVPLTPAEMVPANAEVAPEAGSGLPDGAAGAAEPRETIAADVLADVSALQEILGDLPIEGAVPQDGVGSAAEQSYPVAAEVNDRAAEPAAAANDAPAERPSLPRRTERSQASRQAAPADALISNGTIAERILLLMSDGREHSIAEITGKIGKVVNPVITRLYSEKKIIRVRRGVYTLPATTTPRTPGTGTSSAKGRAKPATRRADKGAAVSAAAPPTEMQDQGPAMSTGAQLKPANVSGLSGLADATESSARAASGRSVSRRPEQKVRPASTGDAAEGSHKPDQSPDATVAVPGAGGQMPLESRLVSTLHKPMSAAQAAAALNEEKAVVINLLHEMEERNTIRRIIGLRETESAVYVRPDLNIPEALIGAGYTPDQLATSLLSLLPADGPVLRQNFVQTLGQNIGRINRTVDALERMDLVKVLRFEQKDYIQLTEAGAGSGLYVPSDQTLPHYFEERSFDDQDTVLLLTVGTVGTLRHKDLVRLRRNDGIADRFKVYDLEKIKKLTAAGFVSAQDGGDGKQYTLTSRGQEAYGRRLSLMEDFPNHDVLVKALEAEEARARQISKGTITGGLLRHSA